MVTVGRVPAPKVPTPWISIDGIILSTGHQQHPECGVCRLSQAPPWAFVWRMSVRVLRLAVSNVSYKGSLKACWPVSQAGGCFCKLQGVVSAITRLL
jgi:hypothetical protein